VVMQRIEDFAKDTNAVELDLKHGCIGDWGAGRLAKAIVAGRDVMIRSVQVINLDGNYIGNAGLLRLVGPFMRCTLKKLMLSRNGITDSGAEALSAIVPKMVMLEDINLAKNYIGDDGARAFAKVLKAKPKPRLRRLDVRGNRIGTSGLQRLKSVDHEALKLFMDGNMPQKGDSEQRSLVIDNLWGSDPGYGPLSPPASRPSSEARSRRSRAFEPPFAATSTAGFPSMPTELASTATAAAGEEWAPVAELRRKLDFAKGIGQGMYRLAWTQKTPDDWNRRPCTPSSLGGDFH